MPKKRVKKRTHVKRVDNLEDPKVPKSFVIRTGKTTADPASSVLAQLVLDVRRIMEPNTATRLRVCRPIICAVADCGSRNDMPISLKTT